MKKIKLFSAVILAAMLCACGHESADIQETNITTAEITTAAAEMTTTTQTASVTTAVTAAATTVATTSKAMVGMDIPKDMRYEYDEEDGSKYAFYQFMPVAIHSNAERVTVKNVNDTIHFREGNLFGGILRSEVSQLPNCRVLTFEEGIEDINWCDQYVNAPSLEILRFPASMDSLILMRNSNFIPESEVLPAEAYVPYDPYIQHYQSEYAGPITEDTITALEEALANAMDTGNQIGLATVLESAQNAPEGAWILPTAPYDAIWSNNLDNYHRRTALITMLFLVLTLAPIGSQERQNNMTVLLTSTSGGRKRLWLQKQLVLLVVTDFVWLMVYGGELIHTANAYRAFQCLSAPAFSLELFRNAPSIPLGGMLALYYGAKLLVLLVIGEICFVLSSRCSKNRDAILVCCAVLLIPAALAAIGSVVGEYLSFLIPLSGM